MRNGKFVLLKRFYHFTNVATVIDASCNREIFIRPDSTAREILSSMLFYVNIDVKIKFRAQLKKAVQFLKMKKK